VGRSNQVVTICSLYKGKELFKLPLSYSKLNLLASDSGTGKTALGLFLKAESDRRLAIAVNSSTSGTFVPQLDWELLVEGKLGFVEFISFEGLSGTVLDYLKLDSTLEETFRQVSGTNCPVCQGQLLDREGQDFESYIKEIAGSYLAFGLDVDLKSEDVLDFIAWAKKHSISRVFVDDSNQRFRIVGLDDLEAKTQAVFLSREVISKGSDSDSIYQAIGGVLSLSELFNAQLDMNAVPKLLMGEVEAGKTRVFNLEQQLSLASRFFCSKCHFNSESKPDAQVNGLTLRDLKQVKLENLKEVFKSYFPKEWQELFELDVTELRFSTLVSELSPSIVMELKLFSLSLLELRDSIIFIDSGLTKSALRLAKDLASFGNCVVAQSDKGDSINKFLPEEMQRLSPMLDKQVFITTSKRKISLDPLLVTSGLEGSIAELYASLPEARVRNLSAGDLKFFSSKCPQCSGLGYEVISISSLGKIAERCGSCFGGRYQEQVGFVYYQDVNLVKLLGMSIGEALELFGKRAEIVGQLSRLVQMGLGNYKLGDEYRLMPSKGKRLLS
jgi:hypothetical protein